jgi:hypothetical protein
MKDGKYMEQVSLPKNWNILYQRTKTQLDHALNKWVPKTFYVRAVKGLRPYGNLSQIDNLLQLGIFNHETQQYQEWAYNDGDQEALFKLVFSNFVSTKERKRLLGNLKAFLQTQQDHTLKPYSIEYWFYKELDTE